MNKRKVFYKNVALLINQIRMIKYYKNMKVKVYNFKINILENKKIRVGIKLKRNINLIHILALIAKSEYGSDI